MMAGWNKKGVAVNSESKFYFIDHLAPIASLMDIPLLFLDEKCYELGKHYYPNLRAELQDHSLSSLEYLIKNYDVSFTSEPWERQKLQKQVAILETRYKKKWQHVFCPHGFSDKGFYFDLCYSDSDVYLVYGDNQIDLLKQRGIWNPDYRYVITGNYRYSYFKQNAEFYEAIFEQEIQSHFEKKRPIIFYAPTWLDQECSGTFEEAYGHVLEGLPADYNLIVKVHPRFELDDPAGYYSIIGQFQHKKNVLFLSDFPPIFPILAHSDIYIGDMSSIGYDFLIFDKPLFLLNKHGRDLKTDRGLFLFRCATEIKPEQYSNIYGIIEKNLLQDAEKMSPLRKKMWNYSFGQERLFSDIRADIIHACE